MTENKIGSLVGDLVAMAKAFEELPKVQEALEIEKETSEICARQVQAREESILGYKRDIDILNAKVRELEVARDDAEFRFLELEEKAYSALALVRSAKADLAMIEPLLEPSHEPKPEPKAVDVSLASPPQSVTEAPSTGSSNSEQGSGERPLASASSEQPRPEDSSKDSGDWANGDNHHPKTASSGQSETLPTASSPDGSGSQPKIAPFDNVEKQESASTATEALPPYTNKFYIDVQGYISRSDWLAGGGTDESYDL